MQRETGQYVVTSTAGESVRAFLPYPLPPSPPLALDRLYPLLDRANQAVGRLDGLSATLPAPELFLYLYVRKEAVLSSQIEGTQSSLSDLLLYENESAPGMPIDDVREVSNYVAALDHGLSRLKEGFPLSLRLIREIHEVLLRKGRGDDKTPGEFRTSQNWIGGTRPGNAIYVPPPPDRLMESLDSFEKFLHDETVTLPLLVQLGLIHVQFETIHPFLDGNGRLGRLLITLLLCARGALKEPLLYLSLHFKTYRPHYYELLQRVRREGAWEEWLEFFLEGVQSTAKQAADTAVEINRLFETDRKRIQQIGRPAFTAMRVFEFLKTKPLIHIGLAARSLELSMTTVGSALARLEQMKIVRETTGRERDRIFAYDRYLAIMSAGTEPIHASSTGY